jgi:hypothetical protein
MRGSDYEWRLKFQPWPQLDDLGKAFVSEPVARRIGKFFLEDVRPDRLREAFRQALLNLGYETSESIEVRGPRVNRINSSKSVKQWHSDQRRLVWPEETIDYDAMNIVVWSNSKATEVLDPDSCEELYFQPNDIIHIDNKRALHRAPQCYDTPRWFIRAWDVRRRTEL